MLKNREHPFPPQGYIFFQPQTNWWSSPGFTFWQTVDEIIKMRKANPRFADQWTMERNAVAEELDVFTCLRLANNPLYCQGDAVAQKKTSYGGLLEQRRALSSLPGRFQGAVAAAGNRVENLGAGIGVVVDWLGDSLEPAPAALAESRARTCTAGAPEGKACPENGRPDFLQKIEGWAASGVKELVQMKNDMELRTTLDESLHHCQACDCALKLKVWAKIDFIRAHTRPEVMERLPGWCWIKTEK